MFCCSLVAPTDNLIVPEPDDLALLEGLRFCNTELQQLLGLKPHDKSVPPGCVWITNRYKETYEEPLYFSPIDEQAEILKDVSLYSRLVKYG